MHLFCDVKDRGGLVFFLLLSSRVAIEQPFCSIEIICSLVLHGSQLLAEGEDAFLLLRFCAHCGLC